MADKKLKANRRRHKYQSRDIGPTNEDFPTVQKYSAVEAGQRLTIFDFRLDFFGNLVVFRGDNEKPATGDTAGTLSAMPAVKCNQGVAVGTVELDCRISIVDCQFLDTDLHCFSF